VAAAVSDKGRKGETDMQSKTTASDLIKRAPEVPEPEIGFGIIREQTLDLNRTAAGVIIPDIEEHSYKRYVMVKTSGGWYAGSTWVEHKAQAGDVVLPKADAGRIDYRRDPRWPADHYLVALQDLAARWPCRTGEPMAKGQS